MVASVDSRTRRTPVCYLSLRADTSQHRCYELRLRTRVCEPLSVKSVWGAMCLMAFAGFVLAHFFEPHIFPPSQGDLGRCAGMRSAMADHQVIDKLAHWGV